ncbi:hypothetical protein [Rubinisphaera margarita]|uniref:hypothetical protein n=1 Tax=Rubinisphaera margarita TaxID=2909586 RepID=UPI001EE8E716|nr:hypothetical protein [Rubinisphaera margarita]MCG6156405.1 hypothetical protein [Rubinisphaera margarita]
MNRYTSTSVALLTLLTVNAAVADAQQEAVALPAMQAADAVEELPDDVPAQHRQFFLALRRVLTVEIHFLRKVCNPDLEHVGKIRAAGEARLPELAKWLKEHEHHHLEKDEKRIQDRLITPLRTTARAVLPAEMADRYEKELKSRDEFRKQAVAEVMALEVDRMVALESDQYDQVVSLLKEKVQPSWLQNMQVYLYGQYCPLPSLDDIAPALDENQKKVWQSQGRQPRVYFGWESDLGLDQFSNGVELEELDDYGSKEDQS